MGGKKKTVKEVPPQGRLTAFFSPAPAPIRPSTPPPSASRAAPASPLSPARTTKAKARPAPYNRTARPSPVSKRTTGAAEEKKLVTTTVKRSPLVAAALATTSKTSSSSSAQSTKLVTKPSSSVSASAIPTSAKSTGTVPRALPLLANSSSPSPATSSLEFASTSTASASSSPGPATLVKVKPLSALLAEELVKNTDLDKKAKPPPTPSVNWKGTPFAGGNLQRVLVALRVYPHFFSDTAYHTVRSAILDKIGFVGIVQLFHSAITSPDVFLDIFSLGYVRSQTALASPRVTDTAACGLPVVYGDLGLERRLLEGKDANWMYVGSASSRQAKAYGSGEAVVGGAKRVGQHEAPAWRAGHPSKHYKLGYAKPGAHYYASLLTLTWRRIHDLTAMVVTASDDSHVTYADTFPAILHTLECATIISTAIYRHDEYHVFSSALRFTGAVIADHNMFGLNGSAAIDVVGTAFTSVTGSAAGGAGGGGGRASAAANAARLELPVGELVGPAEYQNIMNPEAAAARTEKSRISVKKLHSKKKLSELTSGTFSPTIIIKKSTYSAEITRSHQIIVDLRTLHPDMDIPKICGAGVRWLDSRGYHGPP